MNRLDNIVSVIVLLFAVIALIGGVLSLNIPSLVLGSLLLLATQFYRRIITMQAEELKTAQEMEQSLLRMEEGLAFIARQSLKRSTQAAPKSPVESVEPTVSELVRG